MTLKDLLKDKNIPSKEIHTRLNNGNITIDGVIIKDNIELGDIPFNEDIGDFVFNLIKTNHKFLKQLEFFKLEEIIGSNITSELKLHLDNFRIIKFSKKDSIVINK